MIKLSDKKTLNLKKQLLNEKKHLKKMMKMNLKNNNINRIYILTILVSLNGMSLTIK